MTLQQAIDESKDQLALEMLKKYKEGNGWPLSPNTLARLERRGYITSEETITAAGNALLEKA